MRTIALITLFICAAMITLPLAADDLTSESGAKFRRETRLGISVFADYWDYNASYDEENNSGSVKQSGDIQGDLVGMTLSAFRAPGDSNPIFGEVSFRGGELSGDLRTYGSGVPVPYDSKAVMTREEVEFRIGRVLHSGSMDMIGSVGGIYVGSDTELLSLSDVREYSAQTYLGSLGMDFVAGARLGEFSCGARLDSALLLGAMDGSFVWGYDARLTAFTSYEIPLEKFDLVFLLKFGGFTRNYFHQDGGASDVSEVYGAYARAGISLVF